MTFETELRQVQKLEPGDVFLWKAGGQTVTREVLNVTRGPLGTATVRVRNGYGAEFFATIGGRVEVIRPCEVYGCGASPDFHVRGVV